MNYTAPITTTVVPASMSIQHALATKRFRRTGPTLFFLMLKTLRELRAVRHPHVSFRMPSKAASAKEG